MQKLTNPQFIDLLREKDIKLQAGGETLQISAPAGALTADLRAELLVRKSEILALLRESAAPFGAPRRQERKSSADSRATGIMADRSQRSW